MTQPPDEQPTVAWTPPDEPVGEPPDGGSRPSADAPSPADGAPTSSVDAARPTPVDAPPPIEPAAPPAAPPPGVDPGGPLISWAPSGGAAAGSAASAAADADRPVPVVGWDAPTSALPPSAVQGYLTAGVGSRIVAWLLDVSILAILSIIALVVMLVISPDTFARDSVATTALTAILTTGLSFLYFVGQWTGSRGATLGMRSLGLRLVRAPGPEALAIGPAVVRWAAFGYPLTILGLIPVLGSVSSWALTGWTIVLLITTAISDTNQGLHDRFAGSAVLRRVGAGSGWAVIGCVGVIALVVVGLFLLPFIALATLSPEMQDQFWTELMHQLQLEMERQS